MASYSKPFISIEFDRKGLEDLRKKGEKIKEAANLGLKDGTEKIANNLRMAVERRGLTYAGYLGNSIQAVQTGEDEYGVKMLQYGEWLNDAPRTAHWVNLSPGRSVRLWAISKGLLSGAPYGKSGDISKMYVLSDKQHRYGGWIDKTLVGADSIIRSSIEARIGDIK